MRVEVYWNLHKHTFSVRNTKTGRVLFHADEVWIDDAQFVVRKSGRERVLREGKKNVHAFVRGTLGDFIQVSGYSKRDDSDPLMCPAWRLHGKATYNPYKFTSFVDSKTLEPIDKSDMVCLSKVVDTDIKPKIRYLSTT